MVLIFTIGDDSKLGTRSVDRPLSWEEILRNLKILWDWMDHPLSNLLKLKQMSPNEANKIRFTDVDIADYPSKISKEELLHILTLKSIYCDSEDIEIDFMWMSVSCGEIPMTNGQFRQMTIDAVRFVEDCYGISKGFPGIIRRLRDPKKIKDVVLTFHHEHTKNIIDNILKLSRKKYTDVVNKALPSLSPDEQYEKDMAEQQKYTADYNKWVDEHNAYQKYLKEFEEGEAYAQQEKERKLNEERDREQWPFWYKIGKRDNDEKKETIGGPPTAHLGSANWISNIVNQGSSFDASLPWSHFPS